MSATEAAVRLTSVSKNFGKLRAVDDLSLEVPVGSIYGFIGPNGSGKTTTLRMILHIVHPDQGQIEVLGHQEQRAANDFVGYLPEERGLYKKMTVYRVLGYFARLKGMKEGVDDQVREWLKKMGLAEWGHRKVEQLSKGMAQKIQFIAAVIARPRLLILDEPFSGLDPVNLEVLRAAILQLRAEGTTIIFSTHDMGMAEQMCDRLLMIFRGKKVLDGTLEGIQETYGADTIRVRLDRSETILPSIQGLELLRNLGHCQEVRYPGNPQELLQLLAQRTRVDLFEIKRPSLHEIFVRIAGVGEGANV